MNTGFDVASLIQSLEVEFTTHTAAQSKYLVVKMRQ